MKPEIYMQYATKESEPSADRLLNYIVFGEKDFEETIEITVNGRSKTLKIKASTMPIANRS